MVFIQNSYILGYLIYIYTVGAALCLIIEMKVDYTNDIYTGGTPFLLMENNFVSGYTNFEK